MNILHILPTVDPRYGGPVAALLAADAATRVGGVRRTVATLDAPGDPWVGDAPLDVVPLGSPALRRGRALLPVLRYGFAPRLVPWLRRHLRDYDRAIVHGLWHYGVLAARRVLPGGPVPYAVYPHGMLDPWFRIAAPWKHRGKQVSWRLAEGPLLRGAAAVLFTCEGERRAAEGAFQPYRLRGIVAGYGVGESPPPSSGSAAAFEAAIPGLGGRPFLLFLGRLHAKKGIDLLLEGFAAAADALPFHHLVVAGPEAEGTGARLRERTGALGIAGRIHWPGMLTGDAKWGALRGCDALVLPSHGENFGVAVAEALSCGTPVLISDKVAIAPEIAAARAGLVAPDTLEGTTALLHGFAALSEDERAALRVCARRCFLTHFEVARAQARTLAILRDPERFA